MSQIDDLLDRDTDELESLLLAHARRDLAPEALRQSALLLVASAGLGAGMVSGVVAQGARSSALKVTSALVGKWLLLGVTSGVLVLGAAQKAQQFVASREGPTTPAQTRRAHAVGAARVHGPVLLAPSQASVAARPPSASFSATVAAALAPPKPTHSNEPAPPEPAVNNEQAAPPAAASSDAPTGDLTRELELLDQTRSALAQHAPARALPLLALYQTHFPAGSLRAEAAALRVETEGRLGNYVQAVRLGSAFLASYPNSPLAARVSALTERYRATLSKP
jgi:hypothetical protein